MHALGSNIRAEDFRLPFAFVRVEIEIAPGRDPNLSPNPLIGVSLLIYIYVSGAFLYDRLLSLSQMSAQRFSAEAARVFCYRYRIRIAFKKLYEEESEWLLLTSKIITPS